MTTTNDELGAHQAQAEPTPVESAGISMPPKYRRRPMLWVLGVALVALGGLLAAWVTTTVSDSSKVVALRSDVDRGAVIKRTDLASVEFAGDPGLQTVPAGSMQDYVGKRASRDLTAGTLLAPQAVTDKVIPAEGDSLVGVALTPAQLPATALRPGDQVRVVGTPRPQDDVNTKPGLTIDATVVRVRDLSDSQLVVVDVTVPNSDATQLAALVATGRVALVVDGSN